METASARTLKLFQSRRQSTNSSACCGSRLQNVECMVGSLCNADLALCSQVTPADTEWALVTGDGGAVNNTTPSQFYRNPSTSFVYAPQSGLLSLLEHADELQREFQMDTLYIPSSSHCFELKWIGPSPLWTRLRDHVLGYDTILMNQLVNHFGARGNFYHESTKSTIDLTYGVFNPDEAAKSVSDPRFFLGVTVVCADFADFTMYSLSSLSR